MTLAELIAEKVREAIDAALKDSEQLLKDVAVAGGDAAAQGMLGDIQTVLDIITHLLGDIPFIGEILGLLEGPVRAVEDAGGKLGRGFGIGYYLGYLAYQQTQPLLLPLTHEINHLTENEIFDPMTAARLAAKRIISEKFARSEGSGGGLDEQHMVALVEEALTFPAQSELLEMLRRKIVTKAQVEGALEHDGVPGEWIPHLLGLERNLLSAADLALALLRGNISEKFATDYAATLGVDKADLELLTENTGEPPGVMELLEAYRRGFINRERLERGIRQSRVRNEWIDVVEKLRFSPMSTADAARAVVENYMPEQEGAKIAAQNGLEPDHWKFIHESWGRPLAHGEMLSLYHRGLSSRKQVDQAFRESNLKDKYKDQSFELGRRLLPERLIVDAIKFGALTTKEGAKKLLEHGYTAEDAAILIRLGTAEKKNTTKSLTRSELVNLYEQHLMSHAEAVAHLEKLGYSQHDAALELNLADVKAHAAALKAESSHVRNSFLAGRVDATEAENQLTALGMDHGQARHLIGVWKREQGHASRLLTSAQVIKVAEDGIIAPRDALDRLLALGYARGDAVKLLVDKGVKIN